jgi:hypothetical protein
MFGKFGGYLASGTGVIGLILGLVFGGLLAGNGSVTAQPSVSPSASASPTGSSEQPELPLEEQHVDMTPVTDPNFPEVRYEYERQFFKLAIANCNELKSKGVILNFVDGRSAILGPNKNGIVARADFDADGKVVEAFVPPVEDICAPAYFHEEALRSQADSRFQSRFFHLDNQGGESYVWHEHVQSAELSTVYFDFTDGILTNIDDAHFEYYSSADLSFGLTKSQKAILEEVAY